MLSLLLLCTTNLLALWMSVCVCFPPPQLLVGFKIVLNHCPLPPRLCYRWYKIQLHIPISYIQHNTTKMAIEWNSLNAQIPAIRLRAIFSRQVNRFLGATLSAASEWFLVSAVNAQLCHVKKSYRILTIKGTRIQWCCGDDHKTKKPKELSLVSPNIEQRVRGYMHKFCATC